MSNNGKQREITKPVHQLLADFSKAYDSVSRDKMYEILSIKRYLTHNNI